MSTMFWVRRYAVVFGLTFSVLVMVQLLKGYSVEESSGYGGFWALVASTIFIATRRYYARKGVACELCRDTVED